jgi:ornithine cyclodeaminase/alanine dehydrogenase-like protein (mu-crystallin family)
VDKFVCDTWTRIAQKANEGLFPKGLPKLHAEVGEIVAGLKPGRERSDERIMVMNTGMAIEDVAVGKLVYERAIERCVGTVLPFL